jgi:hypothetical protein
MAILESVRTLLATFEAYHDEDFGEVVFDRILIVGDRVPLAGHRGADRFTSDFSVDDGGVRARARLCVPGRSPGCHQRLRLGDPGSP